MFQHFFLQCESAANPTTVGPLRAEQREENFSLFSLSVLYKHLHMHGRTCSGTQTATACFYGVHLSSFSFSSIYHAKRLFDRPRTVRHHLNPTPVATGHRPNRRRGSVACELHEIIFRAFNWHTKTKSFPAGATGPVDCMCVCVSQKGFLCFKADLIVNRIDSPIRELFPCIVCSKEIPNP